MVYAKGEKDCISERAIESQEVNIGSKAKKAKTPEELQENPHISIVLPKADAAEY